MSEKQAYGKAFWGERWEAGRLGFHQADINARLQAYAPRFTDASARVLVPLCGKSRDMAWLAQRCASVTGVEIHEIAVRDFHQELGLQPEVEEVGPMTRHRTQHLELWRADFFDFVAHARAEGLSFDSVFDRAAMIALPEAWRGPYVEGLKALVAPGGRLLVITLDYDQAKMDGPPFSVPERELRERYGGWGEVQRLEQRGPFAPEARFAERGLEEMSELTFLITRHAQPA